MAEVMENCQYTSVPMVRRLRLISHNYFRQSAKYLRSMCEECNTCHDRTVRLVVARQSNPLFVPSVMKTPTPSTDDPAQEELLQKYQERVEKLSQQNRVIKFCIDAGFLTAVDVGQYFMTKDTEEFSPFTESQWLVASTLCQEKKNHLTRKVGFEGTPKLGPYWNSQPATYKVNMEWKLELNLWTKTIVTRGSELLMTEWVSHALEQQQGKRQQRAENLRDAVRKLNVENECTCFCEPIKGWSKTTKTCSCQLIHKNFTHQGKKVDWCWARRSFASRLLRHGHLFREDDGAIEFWRLKECLRNDLVQSQHWSDEKWSTMAKGGKNKKIFQYCTDPSGQEILYLRALQGHSGRNLIDPSLQDNVSIPNDFFEYISHIRCAINLHSIVNSGLIPGRQNLSKRQTVFFTSVDPMNKEHKDPDVVDLSVPRHAQYMHTTWKKLETLCIGLTSNLLRRKDSSFIKQNRTQSFFKQRSQSVVSRRLFRWKLENHPRKSAWITSTASEEFLEKWLDEGIGSRSC